MLIFPFLIGVFISYFV